MLRRSALRCEGLSVRSWRSRLAGPPRQPTPSLYSALRWSSSSSPNDVRASKVPSEAASSTKEPLPSPFFCTTPIFYVNASPHLGHLHSDVLADVLTRWNALRYSGWSPPPAVLKEKIQPTEENVNPTEEEIQPTEKRKKPKTKKLQPTKPILSTGTDEHGMKIQKAAEALGETPQELCDRISERFKSLADVAGVGYTTFIRTTEERHTKAVHEIWRRLKDAGHIYQGVHEGWYSVADEAFYPQSQVRSVIDKKTGKETHEAIETGQSVEWTSETNYKFRLSAFKDQLIEWLEKEPNAILPPSRHAKILEEIKAGLEDLSISRPSSRLSWGIPVPDDPSQSIYVWIDALINYLTVAGFPWAPHSGENEGRAEWEGSPWPADVHVVGKDILRFHAIYWPALLLAAGLPLPKQIIAHGHWTVGKLKMSKSKGNVVDPFEEIEKYGNETLRYFLCRIGGTLASDSNYSALTLQEYYKKYLAGQLGNLMSRISSPVMQGVLLEGFKVRKRLRNKGRLTLPEVQRRLKPLSIARHVRGGARLICLSRPERKERVTELEEALKSLPARVDFHMERGEVAKALEEVFGLLAQVNAYLQAVEPWRMMGPGTKDRLKAVYYTREALRLTAILLRPFMPEKMDELLFALAIDPDEEELKPWKEVVAIRPNVYFLERTERNGGTVPPLFPKLDAKGKPQEEEEQPVRPVEDEGPYTKEIQSSKRFKKATPEKMARGW